jgi:hypothetical protein
MDAKHKALLEEYNEQSEEYQKIALKSFEVDKQIKKMQTTLKSGGKCDGLCGLCLLFDEGCLIHYTLKGFKNGK